MVIYRVDSDKKQMYFREKNLAATTAEQVGGKMETVKVICGEKSYQQRYNELLSTVAYFTQAFSKLAEVVRDAKDS